MSEVRRVDADVVLLRWHVRRLDGRGRRRRGRRRRTCRAYRREHGRREERMKCRCSCVGS